MSFRGWVGRAADGNARKPGRCLTAIAQQSGHIWWVHLNERPSGSMSGLMPEYDVLRRQTSNPKKGELERGMSLGSPAPVLAAARVGPGVANEWAGLFVV